MPPLLPLPDYQRIYQVIYSVLEATGIARTHRACFFFAAAGVSILRTHYKRDARLCVGSMALMVDEGSAQVLVYGKEQDGQWTHSSDHFHAWVECDGWLIDFMAPIMGVAYKEDGATFDVPRNMLQKPLTERKLVPTAIQHVGEFSCSHDAELAASMLAGQPVQAQDLMHVCLTWFRRPPKPMKPLGMGGSHGEDVINLVLKAPSIQGVW